MLICISGPVKTNKTNIVCELINDYIKNNYDVKLFYPLFLEREDKYIISGDNYSSKIIPINDLTDILPHVSDNEKQIIIIDEFQFFDKNVDYILQELSEKKNSVIITGLDLSYYGTPFVSMSYAMSYADKVVKLKGICEKCGSHEGRRSIKLVNNEPVFDGDLISVENDNVKYLNVCKNCYND